MSRRLTVTGSSTTSFGCNGSRPRPSSTSQGRRLLMIKRHRFIDDSWGWEVPVGIVEPGEQAIGTGRP